mgnify:FL=1
MLPEAQARILRWLGPFADGLREAWDVPRELSLPGMAEGLGLVRSALHVPLSHLVEEGLVVVRSAHVIGGGRRRRSVHHLTKEGRQALDRLQPPPEEAVKEGSWFGEQTPQGPAHGRSDDVGEVQGLLHEHGAVALTGLAGIGKSTVARGVAEAWRSEGKTVRWVTVDRYAALSDLATALSGVSTFLDDRSASEWLDQRPSTDLVVLDGCEHMHSLHASAVWSASVTRSKGANWLLVGRAPLQSPESIPRHVLGPLNREAAMHILGDIDDAETVLSRLGGHPLALQLHRPGLTLPDDAEDIETFVTQAVLADLADDEAAAVNELALLPFAVSGDDLHHAEAIADLDERALLLWWTTGGLHLHALVRHVRLDTMDEAERQALAHQAMKHWSTHSSPIAPLLVMHHRLMAGEGGLGEEASNLLAAGTDGLGRLSAVLEDALARAPADERERLLGVAADVAVRRGEVERARGYLEDMTTPDATALSAVLRLEGRADEADALLLDAIRDSNALRPRIALLTARIEDRLPEQQEDVDELLAHLDAMDPATLPLGERRTALLASGLLRFSVLVLGQRVQAATELLADLAVTDALPTANVTDLRWRHAIANDALNSTLTEGLAQHLNGRDDLRARALRMSLLERMVHEGHEGATAAAAEHLPQQAQTLPERRLAARHATCLARLTEDASRRTKLLHAAALHRHAGSSRAAAALVNEAHAMRGA